LDGGGNVGFIFDDEDFGHGRVGISTGIKVVHHTQKVSWWHNDLKPLPNFLMGWRLVGTVVNAAYLVTGEA
jgi:hypothetical protein